MTQKCSEGNKGTSEPEDLFVAKDGTDHPNPRSRWFVFTWFHEEPITLDETMVYLAYGEETCPKTGRDHLQGWVYFKNPRYTFAVRKAYKCFMKKMMGSIEQNDDYCSKQGRLQEFGRKPTQGERKDLHQVAADIAGGATVESIALENPMMYHQYGRTLEYLETLRLMKIRRTEMPTCIWLYGPTGCGKSHKAAQLAGEDVYYFPDDHGWWDGYKGQASVIFDDYRGAIPYGTLLRLADKWPAEVRRRNRLPFPFTSSKIIVTSSMSPEEVYHNLASNDSLDQLHRRFDVQAMIDRI